MIVASNCKTGVNIADEAQILLLVTQGEQLNSFFGSSADTHLMLSLGQGLAAARKVDQRLNDTIDTLRLSQYLLGRFGHLMRLCLMFQILRNTGNAGDRIANFMGHPGSQASDRGKPLVVDGVLDKIDCLGLIFDQHHNIAIAVTVGVRV